MSLEEDPTVQQHEEEEDEEGQGYEDEEGDGEGDDQLAGDPSAPSSGGGGGKRRKKRAYKKAPDAPRRGRSAYVLFSMDARERVKQSLPPGAKVTTVMKEIASKWRELSEDERAVWITKALEDKSRYEQELSVYDGPLKVPNKRAKKDPLAPKRAMSAFLHFSQSMRPRLRDTYPDAKNVDMSKMLGQEWNRMTDEEKLPYQAKAQDDTTRYREAMVAWKHGGKEGNGMQKDEDCEEDKDDPSMTAKGEEDAGEEEAVEEQEA